MINDNFAIETGYQYRVDVQGYDVIVHIGRDKVTRQQDR